MKRKSLLAFLTCSYLWPARMTAATATVAFAADRGSSRGDSRRCRQQMTLRQLTIQKKLMLLMTTDDAEAADDTADADKAAADKVAALIDAIYVQERTDDTDEAVQSSKRSMGST